MLEELTGIVLAGGHSSRFGTTKALIPWGNGNLIESVIEVIKPLFPNILVMVKDPDDFRSLSDKGVVVMKDMTKETHPLGGIFSGLSNIKTDSAFVCGCDMPHIQPGLIAAMWKVGKGFDAVVPVWGDRPQTLFGIYSTGCLGKIEEMIDNGRLKVYDLYSQVRTRFLQENEVKALDPRGLSFIDVDTIDDYQIARKIEDVENGT